MAVKNVVDIQPVPAWEAGVLNNFRPGALVSEGGRDGVHLAKA